MAAICAFAVNLPVCVRICHFGNVLPLPFDQKKNQKSNTFQDGRNFQNNDR
jgi:hypothetical protein